MLKIFSEKTILLVEDEVLIAMNEASMLSKYGFEVVTAHNAKKAIETAEKQIFDMVLMDIDLGRGKMDGTKAAQTILNKQDIPVVFLSSHTEPEVVEKTEGITSYGYIVKNSGETVLLASIKMAFRLHEAHIEMKNQKEHLRETLIKQEQTEEELLVSEERFQKTFSLIPDMISIHDPEMNILYSNWNGFATVPKEKRRAGTKCYRTYRGFDRICPDCRAKTVLETKKPFQEEVKLPDGTWTDIRVIPILDRENNIEMFVEWVRIITKRKEAEIELDSQRSFLSAVLDSLEEAIIICDGEGRITRFFEAARQVHGLPEKPIPPEEWAAYYDLYQVDGVTPLPTEEIPLYRALKGAHVGNQELIVVPSHREPCHFVCNGKAIADEHGRIMGAVVAMHDITSLKEAEKDLQISLEEKEFLMKELGHRVKNNLMMVSSLIGLKDTALGERADLYDLRQQVDAIRLLQEKLNRTKGIRDIDIGPYMQDLLENLFSLSRYLVKLEMNIKNISLPAKTAAPLGLIANEMATNAVKHGFTNEQEPKFSVSLTQETAAGEYILTLANNGKPFPENIDLENPPTLGLRLVSALVSQLRGTAELERSPHPKFTVRFPMEGQE